jgi:hypothetical protein
MANSNISGSGQFKIKLVSAAPAGWSSNFVVDGQTVSDSTLVTLVKGTPKPVTLNVTPGFTPGFEKFTLELSSVANPNAPVKYFTVHVISNVHTLLVNAAGDNNATLQSDVYINGLTAAGCDHLAVMKSNEFVVAKNAGILTEVLNIFYNCAWTFPAFTDPEATAVKYFVDNGKNLLVAGQDIGWDIMSAAAGSHGTPITQDLYTNYLKAAFVDDGSTANNKLVANVSDPIYGTTALSSIVDVYGGNMYPDQLNPVQNGTPAFYYNTTLTKIGAVRSTKDAAKVVYFGVGLEMVSSNLVRNDIIKKTYDWFMLGVGVNEIRAGHAAFLGQNFPNPASDNTTITMGAIEHDMVLQITDLTGRTLSTEPVKAGTERMQISTSGFGTGMYLYRLIDGGRVIDTKKLNVLR